MEFLEIEDWRSFGLVVHGFGMKKTEGRKVTKRDWWGEKIRVGQEAFPLLSPRQVHGDRVVVFNGESRKAKELWWEKGDGLITRVKGYALGVFTADCLPILFFDPVQPAVGVVHVGWRGTAKGISQKAVGKMRENFNSMSENILVAMGPGIGPCCFEVDDPVKKAFAEGGLPWEVIASSQGKGRWSLDLYRANIYLLECAGVKRKNIRLLALCTSCRQDIFHSYRAEGETRGRQLNFIALKEEVKKKS